MQDICNNLICIQCTYKSIWQVIVNVWLALCSIFNNSTGSSCVQIQCYTQSLTLIVLLLLCACANHHECTNCNSDVTSTWCSAYICIANWPCNKLFVTLWNETSELTNQWFLWTWSRVYNKHITTRVGINWHNLIPLRWPERQNSWQS